MTETTTTRTSEILTMAGHFAKHQVNGKTVSRVHALNDGTWTGYRTGTTAPDRISFTNESNAITWLTLQVVAVEFGG